MVYTKYMDNLIHLAISMVEMDTGTTLSEIEREEMVKRIKARIEATHP